VFCGRQYKNYFKRKPLQLSIIATVSFKKQSKTI